MKKIILVVLVSAAVMACKKDRTCTCTITRTGTSTTDGKVTAALVPIPGIPAMTLADTSFSQPVYDVQTIDKKILHVTKSAAKNNCVSYTQPYSETVLTSVPASSFNMVLTVINKGDEKYDCSLK